ncbi:hypothetical protein LNTAR_09619 [Lentisphaera araneosa HTCC2155]|uniref:Uncharacterized protein n=1 Tax=Lentisphaera araneosa HTCC2155 TaxID=313628 RepID=A6DIG5_9BACT|nr:hypothetical protein [Lentisphaera araneosa]EDM28819.1 hypothetical protein LNTAR_09619 [Lentisphaera araneosa HTCC2155]
MIKQYKPVKVVNFIACMVTLVIAFGTSCSRDPNPVDGIIKIDAAKGVVSVSPGDMEKIKEKIPVGDSRASRSYLKVNDKETVKVSGSGSNSAVFISEETPEMVNFYIKGTKDFVEKVIAKVHEITGVSLSLNRFELIAETKTYPAFRETEFSVLEKELGKNMTSLSRSSSSFNEVKTIKATFENGIQEVRLKFSEEFSSLKITIEGDQQFVDRIKALIEKSKKSET